MGIGAWDLGLLHKLWYAVEGDFACSSDIEAYRPSPDPARLYATIPGVRTTGERCAHPEEWKYESFPISINSFGFRGPEVDLNAPDDVYRIVVLGGSNTFGPSVAVEDAHPARMQAALDRIAPGRLLVLNAGLNACVMSQKIRCLEALVSRFRIDLAIIQDGGGPHRFLMQRSGVARLALGGPPPDPLRPAVGALRSPGGSPGLPRDLRGAPHAVPGRGRSHLEASLRCRRPGPADPSLHPAPPGGRHDGVHYARICLPGDLPEDQVETWIHIHPPSHVYAGYGERIVEEVVIPEARKRHGLLP